LFFPYSTDAPVYYWPFATVGLIIANVLVFFGVASGALPMDADGAPWVLQYGQGLHPEQWILSPFMHAGFWHLVGNMIFLWVFGLVVEGKLGPAKFLPIYLLTATVQSGLEQVLMLGATEGGSLGASSAIYGLMAIAAIWAPENSIQFIYWFGIFFGTVLGGTFEFPILGVAAFFIGLDLTIAGLQAGMMGGGITSGLLHLMGVAVGAPLGVLLLKRGVVDCEGWDFFSRYFGEAKPKDKKKTKAEIAKENAAAVERTAKAAEKQAGAQQGAKEQIAAYLKAGNPVAAALLYGKLRGSGLRLDAAALHPIARGLQAAGRWQELAPILSELIEAAPQSADPLRLTLAHVCVTKLDRPGRALELLANVNAEHLTDKQRAAAKQVLAGARAMQAEGVVELDDGGW
jgi:membrane associated rhomboid family serine protease